MPAEPLTAWEREEIRVGIDRGESNVQIARRVGRCRSTIGRELVRNDGRAGYSATAAQARADAMLPRPKVPKLVGDRELAAYVTERLEAKDSPMTISIELARGVHGRTCQLSHESIYQAIYAHGKRGLPKGLHTKLHRHHRCRKHRVPNGQTASKSSPLGTFNLIHNRPPEALTRTEVGHLESDLICGTLNRSAIATVFDRASRHVWLADFPDTHDADAMLAAMCEILDRIPEHLRRTLTHDQGSEMARHPELAELCGIDIYFAEAHSPWQRPTNENGNGLLRRYVGKGTNLGTYTPDDLRAIEHRINTIPRRVLNWNTAHNVYTAAVAMTD